MTSRVTEIELMSYVDWSPIKVYESVPEQPKAVIHVIKDPTMGAELFDPFSEYMNVLGYGCIYHDYRSYGASNIIEDVNRVNRYIRKTYKRIPIFMIGIGYGSLIARAYMKRNDNALDGIILTSLIPEEKGSKWIRLKQKLPIPQTEDTRDKFMQMVYGRGHWHVNRKKMPIVFLIGEQSKEGQRKQIPVVEVEFLKEIGYERVDCKWIKGMKEDLFTGEQKIKAFHYIAEQFEIMLIN